MSGLSPHETGGTGPKRHFFEDISPKEMWCHTLKQNGYFCSSGGKVMQSYAPLPEHIQSVLYSDEGKKLRMGPRFPVNQTDHSSKGISRVSMGGFRNGWATNDVSEDETYYDHQVVASVEDFLSSYEDDAPFYREVGLSAPHGPWVTPIKFKEMYDIQGFQKPEVWLDGFAENAFLRNVTKPNFDGSRRKYWQKSVRNYFSAISFADHHVGRVWDAVKSSRHADNTVIIIIADHGLHLGERNLFRKHTLWEQVANVPLIIHDPSQPVAQVVSDPVGLIDLGPTVMDYAGLPPLAGRVGTSLRPQVEWGRAPDRVVPTFYLDNAAARVGKYRYIQYADGTTEFFDLSKDWWQQHNLGPNHPEFAAVKSAAIACFADYGFDATGISAVAV